MTDKPYQAMGYIFWVHWKIGHVLNRMGCTKRKVSLMFCYFLLLCFQQLHDIHTWLSTISLTQNLASQNSLWGPYFEFWNTTRDKCCKMFLKFSFTSSCYVCTEAGIIPTLSYYFTHIYHSVKIRKQMHRFDAQVTFELYSSFRCLHILYYKHN